MAGAPLTPPSRPRLALAFAVAAVADTLFLWTELVPPLAIALDFGVALALFFLLGARWALLPVLAIEVFPATAVFPTWLLVVASFGVLSKRAA